MSSSKQSDCKCCNETNINNNNNIMGGGVKGNKGKAANIKLTTQLLVVFALAFVAVASIKTFGTASWHASATMDDHGGRSRAASAVVVVAAKKEVEKTTPAAALAVVADDIKIGVAEEKKGVESSNGVDENTIKFVFGSLDGEEGQEGEVIVKLHPEWAPIGVQRIKDLTADSFWDECRAFRVLPNFVVQLGINGDPAKQKKWKENIKDDPVKVSNKRGTVTFAMAGRGTRTTQIFFNKVDNKSLDGQNFAPFGEVLSGMEIIDRIYPDYREKPNQGLIQSKGNVYLKKEFPKMTYVKTATFMSATEAASQ